MLTPALLVLAVMVLVMWRPRGLPIAAPAWIGAGAALALHLLDFHDVARVFFTTWNATLTLIGLMLLSATLEANGAFRAAAHRIARASHGSGRRLFVGLGLLSLGASTLLANDGAILILTPIVAALAEALQLPPRATLAYLFTIGFLCDALSTLLPTSNLTNILLVDALHIPPASFVAHLALPTLALFVVSLGALALTFRRDLPARCAIERLGPRPRFSHRSFVATLVALALLLAGYSLAAWQRWPLGAVVVAVGAGLLAFEKWGDPDVDVGGLLVKLPWSIVLFAFALFLVVFALGKAGAAGTLATLIDPAGRATLPALLIPGVAVALSASLVNNLPVLLVTLMAMQHLGAGTLDVAHHTVPYAALLGANVGSKLTPIGSLATLLWLDMLARRGLRVSWPRYLELALLPTAAALLAALLVLAL